MDHMWETKDTSAETDAISYEFDHEEQAFLERTHELEELATGKLEENPGKESTLLSP